MTILSKPNGPSMLFLWMLISPFTAQAEPGAQVDSIFIVFIAICGIIPLVILLMPPLVGRLFFRKTRAWKFWLAGILLTALFLYFYGINLLIFAAIVSGGRTM